MTINPPDFAIKLQDELESLSPLMQLPCLVPLDIHTWVRQHLRACCKLLPTAFFGLPMFDLGGIRKSIEIGEVAANVTIETRWHYPTDISPLPDVTLFNPYLPGMSLQPKALTSPDDVPTLIIKVDLNRWENLRLGLLNTELSIAFLRRTEDKTVRQKAWATAQELLTKFYPTVTMTEMELAATLGMLDHLDANFVNWFKTFAYSKPMGGLTVPDTISEY